jgi:DNA-binding beta-propeller fold protein YncE
MLGHPPAKNTPIGVAVDGSATVYVTDSGDNRVQKQPPG